MCINIVVYLIVYINALDMFVYVCIWGINDAYYVCEIANTDATISYEFLVYYINWKIKKLAPKIT